MAVQAEAPARARPAAATREGGRRFSPGRIALYAVLILIALFFTVVLLYVMRRRRGGSLTDPGHPDARRSRRR